PRIRVHPMADPRAVRAVCGVRYIAQRLQHGFSNCSDINVRGQQPRAKGSPKNSQRASTAALHGSAYSAQRLARFRLRPAAHSIVCSRHARRWQREGNAQGLQRAARVHPWVVAVAGLALSWQLFKKTRRRRP
ncbi:hypothetical protein Dimus_033064, partial [Dionaea muscipula]